MNPRSAKLGEESIGRLLFGLSFPAAIAMMVNGLYNVVDTIFIGQGVGPSAIGGLAIAFPIQMLIMGIAQMVGMGASSAVSRFLGSQQIEKADKVTGNAFTSIIILSLTFTILGLTYVNDLLYIFGATKTLLPYAKDYIEIILLGGIFSSFVMMVNSLIRAEGNAKIAMISMLIGAILNILLDPVFIFIFNLGIKGAALATIISQFISFIFVMYYMYSGKSLLKVKLHHMKLEWNIIKEIFTVGFSALTRSSTSSIFAIVVNNSLRIYGGDLAITIFGIVNRVILFLFIPIIGVGQGMQPIVGYNYGAQKYDRVKKVLNLSLKVCTIMAVVGWIIGETVPHIIISAFTDDNIIINEGTFVFRIIISVIPLIGIQFVGSTLFQALGKGIPSLILSLLRQLILLIPLILILPRIFNLNLLGVWLAFPIADILSSIITFYMLKRQIKKLEERII